MLTENFIQPGTITLACLAHLPDFAYPYQDLARGVLFRASPEEVRTVVHDAVVVICEVGVGRLRSPLVEVAPFAWNAIEIPVSLFALVCKCGCVSESPIYSSLRTLRPFVPERN